MLPQGKSPLGNDFKKSYVKRAPDSTAETEQIENVAVPRFSTMQINASQLPVNKGQAFHGGYYVEDVIKVDDPAKISLLFDQDEIEESNLISPKQVSRNPNKIKNS